jgi:hypothetical protein
MVAQGKRNAVVGLNRGPRDRIRHLMFGTTWLDVICLALSVGLLEGALTGKGTTHGRGGKLVWPVPLWLRPIFAVVGFALLTFAIVDFFGSAQEFDGACILSRFLKNDKFCFCDRHALRLEQ